MSVSVIDLKGDTWTLMLPGTPDKGVPNVWWCCVIDGPVALIQWYPRIPIPIFTEWWT